MELLNTELARENHSGELYLVGGAVMCLAFGARASTKDIDGFFRPTDIIRIAAGKVALDAQISEDWLNDAVKGYQERAWNSLNNYGARFLFLTKRSQEAHSYLRND